MKVNIHNIILGEDRELLSRYYNWLSPIEKTRADRFRFAVHSQRFISAHGTLRRILSEYLETPPEKICFVLSNKGKPLIHPAQNVAQWQFSMAHSENAAVIVVSQKNNLGVDVEKVDTSRPIAEVIKRYFTTQEADRLSCLRERDRFLAFYRIWTMKESWLKATGIGLAGLHDVETAPINRSEYEIIRWRIDSEEMSLSGCPMDYEHFEPFPGFIACYTRLYSSQTVSTK